MAVTVDVFGTLEDGRKIEKYTIENSCGMKVSVITYGATLTNIFVPDKNNNFADVLVGFDDIDGFVNRSDYQGVTVGPYANRIGGARFDIDGTEYKLTANENGVTCLHSNGEFNTAVWSAEITDDNSVAFSYISPDGLNGFPGNTDVRVEFILTDKNELKLEYYAVSDKKTVINLTNHAYFNLGGYDSGTILEHEISINASHFTPVDKFSIPTGEIKSVEGTVFDLRKPVKIGENIDDSCEQMSFTGGYDHNFCIDGYDMTLKKAADVKDPATGRRLKVYTTLPGIQFYAGNFLKGAKGKSSKPINKRSGFCLETQFYPDTPNKPDFPQCTFEAGEVFTCETVYKFLCD